MLYGMASVGPRKICWPPTWALISLTTSAARLVLSSTNPSTKSIGMIMSSASAQITISFTPMDRDFFLKLACNIDRSLTEVPPYCKVLYIAKLQRKKNLRPQWRQVAHQAGRRLVFRHLRRILNHLLERGKIFEIALAA